MIKNRLSRILVKLGLKNPPQQPPLVSIDELQANSYRNQAIQLINRANQDYLISSRELLEIDSMTTPNELAFLRAYGRDLFSGSGKIIDLGCWFGATSAALAAGLNENPKTKAEDFVEAYDLFEWDEWMNPIKDQIGMKVNLLPGQCFLEEVRNNLVNFEERVHLHKQDLSDYHLPEDWKIEFLFVDAMKNWELARSISRNFFPRLIPQGSIMVMQDFAFYDPIVATNHLVMWHLRDFFTPLHHVPYSCSVAFLTERAPSLSDLDDYSPELYSEEEVEEAYAYCLPLIQESMRPSLLVARLCHHIKCQHQAGTQKALAELNGVKLALPMQATIRQSLLETYQPPSEAWQAMIPQLESKVGELIFK